MRRVRAPGGGAPSVAGAPRSCCRGGSAGSCRVARRSRPEATPGCLAGVGPPGRSRARRPGRRRRPPRDARTPRSRPGTRPGGSDELDLRLDRPPVVVPDLPAFVADRRNRFELDRHAQECTISAEVADVGSELREASGSLLGAGIRVGLAGVLAAGLVACWGPEDRRPGPASRARSSSASPRALRSPTRTARSPSRWRRRTGSRIR